MNTNCLHSYLKLRSKKAEISKRFNEGFSENFGFLHIPKSGGTSVDTLGKKLVRMGYAFPVSFGHSWKVEEICKVYPKIKIAMILRDPLERAISGFHSRLRQGRPTYNIIWTPAEATAMAILPSSKHLLNAMLSEDDFSISAVAYAFKNISHLYWNYCHYFNNPEYVRKNRPLFNIVGHIDHLDKFVSDLGSLCNVSHHLACDLYRMNHVSIVAARSILEQYSENEISILRSKLAAEYAIYDELCKFIS